MKPVNSRRGSVPILEILILVGIITIGGMIFYNQHIKVTNPPKQAVPRQAVKSADPYASWKTATLPIEKLHFKYPADWKFVVTSEDNNPDPQNPKGDSATLTAPSGFKLSIKTNINGIGGACPDCKNFDSEAFTLNGKTAYVVYDGNVSINSGVNNIALSDDKTCAAICVVGGKNTPGSLLVTATKATAASLTDFKSDSDVHAAVLIIKSFSY